MVHGAEILTENKSLLFQWRQRYDHGDAFPGLEHLTWGSTQVAEEHCRFFSLPTLFYCAKENSFSLYW